MTEGLANAAYTVTIQDYREYVSTILPQDAKYIIVGDVHECIGELKGLLLDYGYKIEADKLIATDKVKNTKVILVGDWIDKGKQTKTTLDFLYENQDHFLLLIGNHENFVYKYLRGEIAGVDQELLQSYFDSTQILSQDADLLKRFNQLITISQPFYRFIGVNGPSFFITHAPCRNKYIGKMDSNSARHQRSFRITGRLL